MIYGFLKFNLPTTKYYIVLRKNDSRASKYVRFVIIVYVSLLNSKWLMLSSEHIYVTRNIERIWVTW